MSQELALFSFVMFTMVLAEEQIGGKRVLTPLILKWVLSGSSDRLTTLLKSNSRASTMLPRLRGLKVSLVINDMYIYNSLGRSSKVFQSLNRDNWPVW